MNWVVFEHLSKHLLIELSARFDVNLLAISNFTVKMVFLFKDISCLVCTYFSDFTSSLQDHCTVIIILILDSLRVYL